MFCATVMPLDSYWGSITSNGTYNGMLGQLQRGGADYSPAGYTVTYSRSFAFEFHAAIFQTRAYLYVKNPNRNFNWYAYYSPLVWEVWVGMAVLAVTLPFAIAISARLPPQVIIFSHMFF